jgi:hypothetical protein
MILSNFNFHATRSTMLLCNFVKGEEKSNCIMRSTTKRTYLLVLIFSLAMGFLEAVVVIYLRKISYPHGFEFPLELLPPKLYVIELLREFATLVMLFTLALLAGKNKLERFAYFLFAFAIWDIVYYIGLKLILNWPQSLMTRDILFLIPIPWVSPVLAPLICSLSMIALALGLTYGEKYIPAFRLRWIEWELLIAGALVVFSAFIWSYAAFLVNISALGISKADFHAALERFNPASFHWGLFLAGEILIVIAIFLIWKRSLSAKRSS